MSEKTEETVTIEDTQDEFLLKKKKTDAKNKEWGNTVELFLGCIFVSVVIILTIFSSVLIQVFEVVPTNLVLVKSIIQLMIFAISNKSNGISILSKDSVETTAMTVQGLLSGLAFICSVGAVRLLPLGDFLSIIFSKTVFLMLLMSGFKGRAMTKKKSTLTLICMQGLVLLIKTQTCCNQHQTDLTEVVNAADDPAYSIWLGLGLAFLHNAFSSQAELLRLDTQSAAGVVSFWSAVGGLVAASLSSFLSAEPSLLSGSIPSPMQVFLLLFLSISAISMAVLADQAEKLINRTTIKTIRSLEIPLGLLLSLSLANDCLPSYVGYFGIVLIVINSVVTQATMEEEDSKEETQKVYQVV